MSKPELLEDLQAAFPDWVIWRSSGGTPWATRRAQLSLEELNQGLEPTLSGRDVEELVGLLREQERLEQRLRNTGGAA